MLLLLLRLLFVPAPSSINIIAQIAVDRMSAVVPTGSGTISSSSPSSSSNNSFLLVLFCISNCQEQGQQGVVVIKINK